MRDAHAQDFGRPQTEIAVAANRDPLDGLDPLVRGLVLDILGIFLADALAPTALTEAQVGCPAYASDQADSSMFASRTATEVP